jgi:integrase
VAVLSQGTRDKLRGIMGAALRAAGAPEAAVQGGLNAAAASTGSAGERSAATVRHTILDAAQISRLLEAIAAIDRDLELLARTLDETGSRPIQLLGCTIRDLDQAHCLLHIPASAKGKPGSARRQGVSVPITSKLARDLAEAAKGDGALQRPFTRPLKTQTPGVFAVWQDTGERTGWTKNVWSRPFRDAVRVAALPADATLYSLRHSRIVSLIQANVPLRTVASTCDTSTAMIEAHYSRWIARAAGAVDQVRRALAFGRTTEAVA